LSFAAAAGVTLVLFSSTPADARLVASRPALGNTVDVTRSGKSVKISAEYRCPRTDSAKVSATVTRYRRGQISRRLHAPW
jgi:hypothetical protein